MAELAELLDFLSDWIVSTPQSDALATFCGDAYTLAQLGMNLDRFANFLDPSRHRSPVKEGQWPA
jgi:hypothetical protein